MLTQMDRETDAGATAPGDIVVQGPGQAVTRSGRAEIRGRVPRSERPGPIAIGAVPEPVFEAGRVGVGRVHAGTQCR